MTDSDPSDIDSIDDLEGFLESDGNDVSATALLRASRGKDCVPVEALEDLVQEWREKPGLYNPDMMTDRMQHATQNDCADELEALITDYTNE